MPAEFQEYHAQDAGMQMIHQATDIPQQVFYDPDNNSPGIANMNTDVPQIYTVPQQQVEQQANEMAYSTAGIPSIICSPASLSPVSLHIPAIHDGVYTHQPPAARTYRSQDTTVEPQNKMVPYSQDTQQTRVRQREHVWDYHYQPPVEVAKN
ncbi:hypothetical protein VCV18_012707 [Metarhizium anisopliae]